MKSISGRGLLWAGGYLVATFLVVLYAQSCEGMFCGTVIMLPALPWWLIPDDSLWTNTTMLSWIVLLACYAANAGILYLAGRWTDPMRRPPRMND